MSYIGNSPTTTAFVTDTFSGNGSTTAFTMSVAPATTSSVLVAVTGVLQDPSTYSVSGTTLTFSAAPPTGTGNISVRYLGIPASGVTTTAYRTVTEFTATAGQTSFSVPSYTVGYIDVYRNGVMLGTADFTATTGTTVVLAVGATVGDLIRTESFYVSSVLNAIPATAGAVNSTYIAAGAVGSTQIASGAVGTSQIASSVTLTTPTLTTPTLTSPTISGTPVMGATVLTSGTTQASTSGSNMDFTGIPSWAKQITVMFSGVSSNGTTVPWLVQLGTSGGVESTGYLAAGQAFAAGVSSVNSTAGFPLNINNSAATVINGSIVITLLNASTNLWTAAGAFGQSDTARGGLVAGSKALSGTLTRVRFTTNSADTFDAGSINILYA